MEVTEHQWLLVGEMQAGILRAILGKFESLLGLEYKTMANMEDYMLIKIIININEKIVTDDVDHSGGAEARGMRRCKHASSPLCLAPSLWEEGWAGRGRTP